MDDGTPALEVGFAIDTGGSFQELIQLQQVMDSAEAKIVADAARIEQATGGMIKLGGATAEIRSFASTASAEYSRAEKAGEAMVRQLERQISTFGKTREEVRAMNAEMRAAAAEQQGLTELAGRIRTAEAELATAQAAVAAAADAEAQAIRSAAAAHQMFEARVREGVMAMREQAAAEAQAAQATQQLAAATAGLRGQLDPMFTAQLRFNQAMDQADELLAAGAITTREYAAAQQMARDVLQTHAQAVAGNSEAMRRAAEINGQARQGMQQLSFQLNDVATQFASGTPPMQIFAQQTGQVVQAVQLMVAETSALGAFLATGWGMAVVAATVVLVPFIAKLFETEVAANSAQGALERLMKAREQEVQQRSDMIQGEAALADLVRERDKYQARLDANSRGGTQFQYGFDARRVLELNQEILTKQDAVSAAQRREAATRNADVEQQIQAQAKLAGAVSKSDQAQGKYNVSVRQAKAAWDESNKGIAAQRVYQESLTKAEHDLNAAQEASRKTRKTAAQTHAETLAREGQAVDAQIRNVYALREAYKLSGGAALIAAARVKAESDAIKKRGDIGAAVDRQVRISIAEATKDSQKASTELDVQARIQEDINAKVAAGLVPAQQANRLVQEQIALLQIKAALEAAEKTKNADAEVKAAGALRDMVAAQERDNAAKVTASFNASKAAGDERLAQLREELRLVRATTAERNVALAVLRATQVADAAQYNPADREAYIAQQRQVAVETEKLAAAQRDYNDALNFTADRWDIIANNMQEAARGLGDAFGPAGQALGDLASTYANFEADRARMDAEHRRRVDEIGKDEKAQAREQYLYSQRAIAAEINAYGDMLGAAKGFFNEKSKGYKALEAAEKVFRAFQFAMSVRAMIQDAAETLGFVANSAARATAEGAEGIAAQSKLPFPFNIAAMAATGAALIAAGVTLLGGGSGHVPQSNTGTGTVLGDPGAKSESIKNAINALKDVDTVMLSYSRQMAASLQSIDSQIGGFANVLVRNGDSINAGMTQGFKTDTLGKVLSNIVDPLGILSKIPLIGGIFSGIKNFIGSLFGTKTTVVGTGLFGRAQSVGSILGSGFDADYYTDLEKKKKFFGITTSTKYSTSFSDADAALSNQFTLILKGFNEAIVAAAGPLGTATSEIENRLNGFIVDIGKIELKGLTGSEIEEKLDAVFGAAADNMARAAFPYIEEFQKVGEGAFETLVRVASTVETVTSTLDLLGQSAAALSIAAKLGLADQFESVSAFNSAADAYFQAFYTREEQAAARTAQMGKVFESLGLTMPTTLAGFRQLVEAQNLASAAGQATYATLLQLAPAFADLQSAMDGAKSAADIISERQDLQRQLLELRGDTAALREMQLAKLDASNRALQQQIWAIQDAQEVAKAADELRQAWQSVGDSIMDEVKRIRGLSDTTGANTYASLLSQFGAATQSARGGDMDAAKLLPQLSQALLTAAQDAATSRQELDRIRAQTAASLEATYGVISSLTAGASTSAALVDAGAASQAATSTANDNSSVTLVDQIAALRDEIEQLRTDNNAGHAANASANGKTAQLLDRVLQAGGGDAIAVEIAA